VIRWFGSVGAALIIVVVVAFSLRFYDCAYPSSPWLDEGGHVAASYSYWYDGQFGPDNWEHPPLRHILLHGFLKVFGDNPYGWRMRNILFGSLAATLTGIFAMQISGSRRTALLAGLLLATDPLHIVLSRYTWEEIYGGAFFLVALVCFHRFSRNNYWLFTSAIFLGCALATKWYYVPAWFLLYVLLLVKNGNYRIQANVLYVTCVWLMLPICVYILSYYQWFGRGYTLNEFVQFIINAYYSLQNYKVQEYNQNLLFLSHTSAWEWFVRPIMVGQGTFINADTVEFIVYMNSLPIWVLTFPSLFAMLIISVREKSQTIALPVLLFFVTYLLYFFVKRPAFIYSAVPLLPFAFTAIAFCVTRLAERIGSKWFYWIPFVLMMGWNIYLYPLVTAKKLPLVPYRYLLERSDISMH
jgi:dolichyl-phosphate-mannose-protein mannosyltransferase